MSTLFSAEGWQQFTFIAQGITVTLQYTLCSVIGGLLLGTLLALCKISHVRAVNQFAHFYTSIFRGTPLMVQLSIVYLGLPSITGLKISAFAAGILAFSLNSAAYVSEIIYAGVTAIDKGQRDAAAALGATEAQTLRDVILPQAVRHVLPSLINEIIDMLKESSLISIIGEADIMRRAQLISAENYSYFQPLLMAACCYYVMVLFLSTLAKKLQLRLNVYDSH